jgi:hypothetical protein
MVWDDHSGAEDRASSASFFRGMSLTRLEASAQRFSAQVQEKSIFWLGYFSVVFLICTAIHSWCKPLWFDEIFTDYIARLPRLGEVLAAIRVDNNPPLCYLLTRLSHGLLGTSDLVTRLPSFFGFLAMCISLYYFVAARCGGLYGLAAMLFPVATAAYGFAYEARPYGLLLGFGGAALLSWQLAAGGSRRKLGLLGLAFCLAGAATTHYFGLQIVFPLVVAEGIRSWKRGRLDRWIWLSMAVGVVSMLLQVSLAGAAASALSSLVSQPDFLFRPSGIRLVSFYASSAESVG